MTLMIAVIAIGALVVAINKLATRQEVLACLLILGVLTPSAQTIFNGQADYDGMTLFCLSLLLFIRNWPTTALVAFVLGMTSPEQGTLAIACLLIIEITTNGARVRQHIMALLVTFLTARLNMQIILRDEDIDFPPPGIYKSPAEVLAFLPHLFAGALPIVLLCLATSWREHGKLKSSVLFCTIVLIPLSTLVITSDGARNMAPIITISTVALAAKTLPRHKSSHLIAAILATSLLQLAYLYFFGISLENDFPTIIQNLARSN